MTQASRSTGGQRKAHATKRRCGVYLRMSEDRTGDTLGVQRQKSSCAKKAHQLGWEIVAYYPDNDVSASSGKKRPEYERMLADLRAGLIDAVVVWDLDRLTRRPIELEEFINLADEKGIALASIGEEYPLDTDNGRLFARIKAAVARAEVERKSARQKAANLQAAEMGKVNGGSRPFGYTVAREIIRSEEREIRHAYSMLLAGSSVNEIVRDFNARGVVTSTGRTWNATTMRQTLMRASNAGIREYHGEIMKRDAWPAIVTEDEWRAVVSLLSDRMRRSPGSGVRRWQGSGLYRCGICGDVMRSSLQVRNGRRRMLYVCRASAHLGRAVDPVDTLVDQTVIARLTRADAIDLLGDPKDDSRHDLQQEAKTLRLRLEGLADAFADGDIDKAQLRKGTERLRTKLADVEGRLAASTRTPVLAELVSASDAAAKWAQMSVTRRQAVIDTLMSVRILSQGKGGQIFDPTKVEITWKD